MSTVHQYRWIFQAKGDHNQKAKEKLMQVGDYQLY